MTDGYSRDRVPTTSAFNRRIFAAAFLELHLISSNTHKLKYTCRTGVPALAKKTSFGGVRPQCLLSFATKAGPTWRDRAFGVAVDDQDSAYITGEFARTAVFASAPRQISLTVDPTVGLDVSDVFIAKYAADGNVIWATVDGQASAPVLAAPSFSFAGTFRGHAGKIRAAADPRPTRDAIGSEMSRKRVALRLRIGFPSGDVHGSAA